jgi:nucleotide-binding universal stress UspA family protein
MRNIPLTIIYVAPSAMAPGGVPMPAGLTERVEKHGHAVLRGARSTAEEAAEGADPIRIDTEIVSAAVLPTLIGRSKEADMIVVGCRGLGAIGRRLLGSVSSGLVHHAHCPVAIIHDEDPMMPYPAKAPVVVGIDGSPASEQATAIAFEEASRRGVDLVAVHA